MDFNIYLSRLKNAWNKSNLPSTKSGKTTIKKQSNDDIKIPKTQPKKETQKKPTEKKEEPEKKKRTPKNKPISSKKSKEIDIKKKRKTSVKKNKIKPEKPKKQKIEKIPLREKYMKQRARIQGIISRAKKAGLTFDATLEDILPKKPPRRVTQRMLDKLKNIKPRDIHKKGFFVDTETGEIIGGIEHIYNRRKEKREAKKIAKKVFKKKLENRQIELDELPTIDSVGMLIERIQTMHSIYGHEYANLKSICLHIINENMREHPKEYREYIKNAREKISECLEVLLAPSNQETIEIYSEELVRVLNMNTMTLALNDMLVDYVYE